MTFFSSRIIARQAEGDPGIPSTLEKDIEDNTKQLLAVVGSLYGLALLAVLLRVWVRTRILKSFGPDDWLMTIAMLLSTACLVCIVSLTRLGLGKHVEILQYHPQWVLPLFAWLYFYSIFVILAYSFIKLSIAVFLLRLTQRTRYRWALQGILVFLVAFTIGSVLAIILQCKPVAAGYDLRLRPPTGTGTCYSVDIFKKVGVFNSSINIATDLLFAILPIPLVWKLQLTTRTKVGLVCILSLGFFAAATAIYKTPMQYHFFEERDFTGHGSWYYVWQIVEMNIGIVAACLPTIKPLFITFFEKARALTAGRTGRTQDRSGYFEQREPSGHSLDHLSGAKGPYNAHVVSIHEPRKQFRADNEGYVHWDAPSKNGSQSDEVPLHGGWQASNSARGKAIIKTSEVHIS